MFGYTLLSLHQWRNAGFNCTTEVTQEAKCRVNPLASRRHFAEITFALTYATLKKKI